MVCEPHRDGSSRGRWPDSMGQGDADFRIHKLSGQGAIQIKMVCKEVEFTTVRNAGSREQEGKAAVQAVPAYVYCVSVG